MVQEPFSRTCSIDKIKSAQKGHCTSAEPGDRDIAETVSQSRIMKTEGRRGEQTGKKRDGGREKSLPTSKVPFISFLKHFLFIILFTVWVYHMISFFYYNLVIVEG